MPAALSDAEESSLEWQGSVDALIQMGFTQSVAQGTAVIPWLCPCQAILGEGRGSTPLVIL